MSGDLEEAAGDLNVADTLVKVVGDLMGVADDVV